MSFNLGNAHGIITLDASGVNNAVQQAQRSFDSMLGNIGGNVQRMGQHMRGIGMQTTLAFAPITAFVTGGIRAFADFDATLTEIEARTGATAEQMELVRATALQFGQDSAFSATAASEAMLQLLSSGYDLEQTFTALPDVLNLAAAGTLDLGYAADAVTDILAQFSQGADQAGVVADALVQAAGSSSATVDDLIAAFVNAGPTAHNFGMSIEETSAALAVFSENGIKGSDAGTQLKTMLTQMAQQVPATLEMWDQLGVSMWDSAGNMRDLDDIIDDLNIAMEGMSDQERITAIQTLAGSYGQTGLSALLAADGIDQMEAAMANAADAETVAAAQMSSFRGATNMLKSSLETISINVLGPLVENYVQPLIEGVTVLANRFNAWATANPQLAAGLGLVLGVLAMLGPTIMIGGQALIVIGMGLSAVGAAMAFVLSPIGLLIVAIVGLYLAFRTNFLGIRDFLQPFIDLVGETLPGAIDQVVLAFRLFITPVQAFLSSLRNGASITEAFAFAWSRAALILPMAWDTFKNALLSTFGVLGGWLWDNIFAPAWDALSNYFSSGAAWADLSAFGTWLRGALKVAWDALADVGGWLFDNLIAPAIGALADYIGSGAAVADLGSFAGWLLERMGEAWTALGALGKWAYDTFVSPVATELSGYLSSGAAVADLRAFGDWLKDALATAWSALGNLGQWAWENLVIPMITALTGYINTGGLAVDMNAFGVWLRGAFETGWRLTFEAVGGIARWAWDTFVQPIITALTGGAPGEGGTAGGGGPLEGLGRNLLQWTADAIAFLLIDAPRWVWNNILSPILTGLLFPDHDFSAGGMNIGDLILQAIIDAFGDLGEWINTHLLAPMARAITAAPHYLAAAVSTFTNWLGTTITNAFRRLAGLAQTYIVNPVRSALTDLQNIANTLSLGLIPGASGGNPAEGTWIDNPNGPGQIQVDAQGHPTGGFGAGGDQAGTPWTGSVPIDQITGAHHGQEAVIPHGGMAVYPSPGGLRLGGDIGHLLMGMLSGTNAHIPALAGASGGGGGDTYNISVPITVDAALANDPMAMQRAEQIGRRVADTAERIMRRRRSQGG